MNTHIKFIISLFVVAFLAAIGLFLVPHLFPIIKEVHQEIAIASTFATTAAEVLAAWYFLTSLKKFKRGLKIAYTLFALGILIFSIFLVLPTIDLFAQLIPVMANLRAKLPDDTLNISINTINAISFAIGPLLMYLGMRKFAQLLKVRYIGNSLPLMFGLAFTLGAIA